MELPKIAAIDFDGTLVEDRFPDIGPMNKRMFCICKGMQQHGVKLILWSSRNGEQLQKAVDFCKAQGLEFDAVNENLPEVIQYYGGGDTRKVFADIYIDDKAIPHNQDPIYWMNRVGM